jgi:hypothetical protein
VLIQNESKVDTPLPFFRKKELSQRYIIFHQRERMYKL